MLLPQVIQSRLETVLSAVCDVLAGVIIPIKLLRAYMLSLGRLRRDQGSRAGPDLSETQQMEGRSCTTASVRGCSVSTTIDTALRTKAHRQSRRLELLHLYAGI